MPSLPLPDTEPFARVPTVGAKAFFVGLDLALAERGYCKTKARGMYYWLWELESEFPLYCNQGKFGSNKLFIDAKFTDLARLLSAIQGVIPSDDGATKNQKFDRFSARTTHRGTGLPEYEGWRFQFKDAGALHKFLNVCEAFAGKGLEGAAEIASSYDQKAAKATSRQATVTARVGQRSFREMVIRYWKTCAVTGCELTSVLKASHIKPWAASSPLERLDRFNGILLVPNLDALFDFGLISFTDEGGILTNPGLSIEASRALGVSAEMRLKKVNAAHLPYLRYHRERVYASRTQKATRMGDVWRQEVVREGTVSNGGTGA